MKNKLSNPSPHTSSHSQRRAHSSNRVYPQTPCYHKQPNQSQGNRADYWNRSQLAATSITASKTLSGTINSRVRAPWYKVARERSSYGRVS